MTTDRTAVLLQVLATVLLGLMAGFFFAFWVDVAPAMAQLDASAYIRTQQAINSTVRNAPFALAYFGAALVPGLAALALWMGRKRGQALAWAAIALTYLLGVFVLTREINIPINNALALWDPATPPADWARARDRWNAANFVRGMAALAAFAAAVAALAWPAPKRAAAQL
jgi:uncharacterized membrane protein